MSVFTPEAQRARDGEVARLATLLFADFKSGAMRFWDGAGDLVAGGYTWQGTGGYLSVSELDLSSQAFAATFSVTLSGIPREHFDAYAALMASDPAEYRLRRITISLITFDEEWQPVGTPIALASGLMDRPAFSLDVTAGPRLTLQCEGPFATRKRPRYGYYTDKDQRRRYPGDRGLEFTPIASTKTVKSPVA